MLRFYADRFLKALKNLDDLAHLVDSPQIRINAKVINAVTERLAELRNECEELGLPMSVAGIDRMTSSMDQLRQLITENVTGERLAMLLKLNVAQRIEDELKTILLFQIPVEKTTYFEQEMLFGSEVAGAFPSAAYDIRESGTCFAAGRNTACVFHLMRVLEIGLTCLANNIGVPSDRTNWETIIGGIEAKIRDIGKDRSRKDECEYYSQAASHFRIVKDAWRNYTAHARGKYDENEASTLLVSVIAFMQVLSKRLSES